MLKSEYFHLKHLKKNGNLNLFVDASFVINLYGVNEIAKNPEYRKKRVTKISVISDDNKTIIGACFGEIHLDANQKPAFRHDVKMVQKTLNNIGFNIPHSVTTKIGGDKGYVTLNKVQVNSLNKVQGVTKKRFLLNNGKRSPIITRKKKNQIKKNTSTQKKYLKKRYTVENAIASIKKYSRIMVRRDKLLKNYSSFLYLGLMVLFYARYFKNNK